MQTIRDIAGLSGDKENISYPLFADCAMMPYRDALALQEQLQEQVASGELPGVFLFVEHPPVITLGIRKDHNRLLSTEAALEEAGVDVVAIRRGGGSTAHNPGQLVIYPILDLPRIGFRVVPYVRYLEQAGMDLLDSLGVPSSRRDHYPGLWVGESKIASIGVQLNRGVTMHGIALNLYNDLGIFDNIVACGIDGVSMTNVIQQGGALLPMEQVKLRAEEICSRLLPEKVRRSGP